MFSTRSEKSLGDWRLGKLALMTRNASPIAVLVTCIAPVAPGGGGWHAGAHLLRGPASRRAKSSSSVRLDPKPYSSSEEPDLPYSRTTPYR